MAATQEQSATGGVRYRDLREWLERVEALGELKRISGANWQSESGALTEIHAKREDCKALVFDDVPGIRTVIACSVIACSTPAPTRRGVIIDACRPLSTGTTSLTSPPPARAGGAGLGKMGPCLR